MDLYLLRKKRTFISSHMIGNDIGFFVFSWAAIKSIDQNTFAPPLNARESEEFVKISILSYGNDPAK